MDSKKMQEIVAKISFQVAAEVMKGMREQGFGRNTSLSIMLNTAAYIMGLSIEQFVIASTGACDEDDESCVHINHIHDITNKAMVFVQEQIALRVPGGLGVMKLEDGDEVSLEE